MENNSLLPEEYEKILTFQSRIDPLSDEYNTTVMTLLRDLFGGPLAVYSKWSDQNDMYYQFSKHLSESFVAEAHKRLLQDPTYELFKKCRHSNDWNGILWSQDYEELNRPDSLLFQYLHDNNIYYFATLLISTKPNEHYVLFKSKEEGPFGEHERMIIQYLHDILSKYATIRKRFARAKNSLYVIRKQSELDGRGYFIANAEGDVIEYNDAIFRMIPNEVKSKQVSDIVRKMIAIIDERTGMKYPDISDKVSVMVSGYKLSVEEIPIITVDHERVPFYVFSSSASYYREMEIDHALSMRYNLTERESQIADLIIKGMSNKVIADTLCLSMSTVKMHNANIFRKLQIHNRMGIVEKLSKKK